MACNNSSDSLFTPGSLVEVKSDAIGFNGVWYVAKVLEPPPSFSKIRKTKRASLLYLEYQTLLSDDGLKPLTEQVKSSYVRPLPAADDHDQDPQVNDVVDAFYQDGWWVGVVTKVNEESKRYSVFFENPPDLLEFERSNLRFHRDWDAGKWVGPQKKEVLDGLQYQEQQTITHENSCSVEKHAVEMANHTTKSQMEWSSVSTENSVGKATCENNLSIDATDSCPLKDLLTMMKRKQGRPRSLKRKRGEQKQTSVVGSKNRNDKKHDEARGAIDAMGLKDHTIIGCQSSKTTEQSKGTKYDRAGDAVYDIFIDAESPKTTVESGGATTLVNGSEDASAGEVAQHSDAVCSTGEAETAIAEIPSNMATVAEPLSMSFDRFCTQRTAVDLGFIHGWTVNQWNEATGRLTEIAVEHTANEPVSNKMPDENRVLPYVDPSPTSKALFESLGELLQRMPQKPHFHPLQNCKEMYREGLEVAYLLTYAKVVKLASNLQINDPKTIFHTISETLLDLELHGFDVKAIQKHVNELRLVKDRNDQLQQESKEVEHQLTIRIHEQAKLKAEIDELVKKVKVLEEEKRRIMLLKEENDSKIIDLKLSVDARNQDIQSLQMDFESIAASPW